MNLYHIEFYDLRDVFHDVNIIAESPVAAVQILQEYFAHARVSVLFEIHVQYTDPVCYADERSTALNAYKYGYFPPIKNR